MAKTLKNEDLRLNIIVNGDSAKKTFYEAAAAASHAKNKWEKAKNVLETFSGDKSSQEYKKLLNVVHSLEGSYTKASKIASDYQRQLKLETMTLEELRRHLRLTKSELDKAKPGTREWKAFQKELLKTNERIREVTSGVSSMGQTFKSIFNHMSSLFVVYRGMMKIVSATDSARQAFLDYDEALTDARKTTNLTEDEINDVADSLKKLDTRTSTNDLLGLVRAGGKLGIQGKEDLLGFAKAADQINVALSKDLGGNAEEAITAIGKMTDIFGLKETYGTEESMLKVGSAINTLGMASTANEGYIVEFARRMAGIAPNAEMSIDKVLGLAATLDQFGQSSETSATALGQVIVAMYKKTDTFAKIAKMSFDDFKSLLETDVNEALLRVLGGMQGNEGGMANITAAMGEMHLNGQRAVTVLGALSNNLNTLRSQQELAARAFNEGTSITEEATLKNNTAAAVQEKLQKKIHDTTVEIGKQLQPAYNSFLETSNNLLSIFSSLIGWLVRYKTIIIAASVALASLSYQQKVSVMWTKMKVTWGKLLHFWTRSNSIAIARETQVLLAQNAANKNIRTSTLLFAAAKNLLAGNIKTATTAIKAFGAAVKANPIGWIISGISIAAGIFMHFSSKVKESREEEKRLREEQAKLTSSAVEAKAKIQDEKRTLDELRKSAINAAKGSDERRRAIKAINDNYGSYLPKLLSEKDSNEKIASSLKEVNSQLAQKLYYEAREADMNEVTDKALSSLKQTNQTIQELFKDSPEAAAEAMTYVTELYNKLLSGEDASVAENNILELIKKVAEKRRDLLKQEAAEAYAYRKSMGTPFVEPVELMAQGIRNAEPEALYVELMSQYRNIIDSFKNNITEYASRQQFLDDFYKALLGGTQGKPVIPDPDMEPSGNDDSGGKWSLSSDKEFLKQKHDLTLNYLNGEIATEEEYNAKLLQLEIDILSERLKATAEGSDERLSLEQELYEKQLRLKKNAAAAAAKSDKDTLASLDEQMASEKAQYELKRQELENYWDTRISMVAKGSEEEKRLLAEKNKDLLSMDAKYLTGLQDLLKEAIDEGFIGHVEIPADKLLELKKKLAEVISKALNVDREQSEAEEPTESASGLFSGTGDGSLFGVSQEQWQTLFDNIEQGKLGAQDLQSILAGIGGVAQEGFQLASMAIQKTNAKEKKALNEYLKANEKEKEALKDKYDAGLITQAQYDEETARLEEEAEARKAELETRQAERQKKFDIAQAVINNALAVTKTWAQWGWPAGIIPAAIQTALGAAQVTLISSTPVSGLEKGGRLGKRKVTRSQDGREFMAEVEPDKRGYVDGPTVIVGENGSEYVLPAEAVSNPSIAPFINTIESARKAGTLRNLNLAAVAPISVVGRAAGGAISDGGVMVPAAGTPTVITIMDDKLMSSIDRLYNRLANPIVAEVAVTGRKGIVEKMKEYNRIKENGTL